MLKRINIQYEIKGKSRTGLVAGQHGQNLTCLSHQVIQACMGPEPYFDLCREESTLRCRTEAHLGCDLLVSRREIVEFELDGYTFSAR